ncbi:MAG: TadE/TadG family type IV pilus assembly protein [Acidimicrobiales bacterium]
MEFALVLPVVALAALLVVQVGLVVHARIMTTHAAREAARVVAIHNDAGAARSAALGAADLDPARLTVSVSGSASPGSDVTVTVTYRAPTEVPLVGALLDDVVLTDSVTMLAEG